MSYDDYRPLPPTAWRKRLRRRSKETVPPLTPPAGASRQVRRQYERMGPATRTAELARRAAAETARRSAERRAANPVALEESGPITPEIYRRLVAAGVPVFRVI